MRYNPNIHLLSQMNLASYCSGYIDDGTTRKTRTIRATTTARTEANQ